MRRLEHGERIKHFETVRVAKSSERIDVSLMISLILSRQGKLIGASTIAISAIKGNLNTNFCSMPNASLVTAVSGVGVREWELDTDLLAWKGSTLAIYDFQPTDRITFKELSACVQAENLPGREAPLRRVVEQKVEGSREFRIVLAGASVKNLFFARAPPKVALTPVDHNTPNPASALEPIGSRCIASPHRQGISQSSAPSQSAHLLRGCQTDDHPALRHSAQRKPDAHRPTTHLIAMLKLRFPYLERHTSEWRFVKVNLRSSFLLFLLQVQLPTRS